MHKIKKYANRKLYDTTDKKYVSLDQLAELIKSGEEVQIVDNISGDDITSSIVSQLLAREKKGNEREVPSSVLIQLLRRGGDTLVDYAKKSTNLMHSAVSLAEDEIDKLADLFAGDKELSESEGSRLKTELRGHANHLKNWISETVDRRMNEVLKVMKLATQDQVAELAEKIESLSRQIELLEKNRQPAEPDSQERPAAPEQ